MLLSFIFSVTSVWLLRKYKTFLAREIKLKMGCVASKIGEEEQQVVIICRERKKQLKVAVEKRYALANAHCRYCQALYAVAASLKLFVARHSSPTSPYLITLPLSHETSTNSNIITNPTYELKQQQQEEEGGIVGSCDHCCNDDDNDDGGDDGDEGFLGFCTNEQQKVSSRVEYFNYMQMQMPHNMDNNREFGWDFFNPFDGFVRQENSHHLMMNNNYNIVVDDDDDLRVVRENEGIPELEEEEEGGAVVCESKPKNNVVDQVNCHVIEQQQQQQNGLAIGETGRDLMEALQDIQDHFIRAYDSGKDVSRMLEANRIHLQSSLDEIKENSTKIIQSITWHRSISSTKSSSCKSLVASSSKGCSTWTDFKNDLFDDYGGMDSGSHSLTLGRLYAWEKKLYEEVKAGDNLRKIYERKCARLKDQEVRGDNEMTRHKTRATVKDIYAQILVAIRSAESISMRIQKLRDEELQPQIVELLNGLRDTWKVMMETHETQNKILSEVKTFSCPSFGKFSNDSHRLATLQVEAELHNLRECFLEFVKVQKAYVQALHSWLTKFLVPEVEFYSKGRSSGAPYLAGGPKLLITCHEWLASMKKLPDKDVAFALKSFSKDVQALWTQQGEEQQQKRKVDSLTKELDRRTLAFQKNETRFLESKLIEYQSEENVENRNDHLTEKKDQLDALKRKLEVEQEKHRDCVQETKRMTLNGFQTGFTPVFKSLAEFSKASWKMYNELVSDSESTEKAENQSYIEGSQAGENSER